MKTMLLRAAFLLLAAWIGTAPLHGAAELVYADDQGVIRWKADGREVALFGANYSLPSSCDFRAAGYIGADRKKLVEKDLLHFARMGWDGMRLCLWGDWENSDKLGNLISNEHLDLMDYAIYQAKQRGIYILLTPITTYDSQWPDSKDYDQIQGFSKFYKKGELGTNPDAIAAQCNYLRQMMNHVNPYTGIAIKDEPAILFVEMINEPSHHSNDLPGSIAYIDALAGAVRGTGCEKILFHNLSQDFNIAPAIKASKAQGVSFAWYPTGLNSGHELKGNYLRSADSFPPMLRPDLLNVPKVVYEFDSADMNSGYMYPAMIRAFRGVGAQFAAMFSYDMLDTAPYNLGWQTHFLNLVYSPKKAMSAVIAAEAMRALPRYSQYGDYPDNRRFGPFRVSYEEDLSEMATDEKFLYANDTRTAPPNPAALQKVAGVGSSPVVEYEGCGCYFLDKIRPGLWRLEVYPDAVSVLDPFAQKLNYQNVATRLVWHSWPMTLRLPDLGEEFSVAGLNEGNAFSSSARAGRFDASPGVYLLSRAAAPPGGPLPERIGGVGLKEFVCPPAPDLPTDIIPSAQKEYPDGHAVAPAINVISRELPKQVILLVGDDEGPPAAAAPLPMTRVRGYRYETDKTSALANELSRVHDREIMYGFRVEDANGAIHERLPQPNNGFPRVRVVKADAPLMLLDPSRDGGERLAYTRIGDAGRRGVFKNLPATDADPAALRLIFPLSYDRTLDDYTASLTVNDSIANRGESINAAKSLRVKARGAGAGQQIYLTLMEADGTAWTERLNLTENWQDFTVPLDQMKVARGVKLPLGFPERWNYWTTPAKGRGGPEDRVRISQVERVQFSFRPSGGRGAKSDADASADIASVNLSFE